MGRSLNAGLIKRTALASFTSAIRADASVSLLMSGRNLRASLRNAFFVSSGMADFYPHAERLLVIHELNA